MRHRPPHFTHVFSGGYYASAYYSYMWSEVLDADAFAAFEETGDIFNPEMAREAPRQRALDRRLARSGRALRRVPRPAADRRRAAEEARLRRRTRGMIDLHTAGHRRGVVCAPHAAAAEAGRAILGEGGNALEAMVAMAATHRRRLSAHEPHRRRRLLAGARAEQARARHHGGGPGRRARHAGALSRARGDPVARAARGADRAGRGRRLDAGGRGRARGRRQGLAARRCCCTRRSARPATAMSVAKSQARLTDGKARRVEGRARALPQTFLPDGKPPEAGAKLKQSALAFTLDHLARAGLDDFYRGDVGREIAADLEKIGSPVTRDDLKRYHASIAEPLSVKLNAGTIYNTPPPTQGLASLIILALYERLRVARSRELRVRPRPRRGDQARLPRARPHRHRSGAGAAAARAIPRREIPRRRSPEDRPPQGREMAGAARARATRSGWARPTRRASRCPTSSRSIGSSAPAACCPRPAC